MRSVWMAVVAVAILGGALATGCGGAAKGSAAEDESINDGTGTTTPNDFEDPTVNEPPVPPAPLPTDGTDKTVDFEVPLCEHCGEVPDFNWPPPPPPTCAGERCGTRFCKEFRAEKDISFVLVQVPCPDLVSDLYLISGRTVLLPRRSEPSNCEPNLVGFKFEGVNTQRVEVCLESRKPIDPGAITVQVKAGRACDVVLQGEGGCLCNPFCKDRCDW